MSIQPSFFEIPLGSDPMNTRDTREMARKKVAPTVKQLLTMLVKDYMTREFGADEWAIERGLSILVVRPRVSNLKKAGLLMRTKYGLTIDGNSQDVHTLYPYYVNRIETLAAEFGLDKAIEAVLEEVNA